MNKYSVSYINDFKILKTINLLHKYKKKIKKIKKLILKKIKNKKPITNCRIGFLNIKQEIKKLFII